MAEGTDARLYDPVNAPTGGLQPQQSVGPLQSPLGVGEGDDGGFMIAEGEVFQDQSGRFVAEGDRKFLLVLRGSRDDCGVSILIGWLFRKDCKEGYLGVIAPKPAILRQGER